MQRASRAEWPTATACRIAPPPRQSCSKWVRASQPRMPRHIRASTCYRRPTTSRPCSLVATVRLTRTRGGARREASPHYLAAGMRERRSQLLGNAMMLACVAALTWGVLAVLRPFLSAIIWASIIVVASWPIMLHVQRLFGGRRGLAVAAMSSGLFIAVVAPVAMLLATLVTRLPDLWDLSSRLLAGPWP